MLFSTLSLFIGALSVVAPSNASFQSDDTLYGGNVEQFSIDNPPVLDETLFVVGDTGYLFNVSITGNESVSDESITYTLTYNNYFNVTYNIFDGEHILVRVSTQNAYRVSPSFYGSVDVYKVNSNRTLISSNWFNTISSYDDGNEILLFSVDYDVGDKFEFNLDLYAVYTYPYDPVSMYPADYQQGFDDGYNNGYKVGFNEGVLESRQEFLSQGYELGLEAGYNIGYTDGYNYAMSTHDYSFTNLFASIGDTPFLIIRRLFGFELFGVEMITVFMSLFTALIVIKIIKKVF